MKQRREQRQRGSVGAIHWVVTFLCAVFVVGMTLQVLTVIVPAANAAAIQAELLSSPSGEPCDGDHGAVPGEHCHLSNVCPLCAPSDGSMALYRAPSAIFPVIPGYALPKGDATDPQLRPPQV